MIVICLDPLEFTLVRKLRLGKINWFLWLRNGKARSQHGMGPGPRSFRLIAQAFLLPMIFHFDSAERPKHPSIITFIVKCSVQTTSILILPDSLALITPVIFRCQDTVSASL